MITPDPPADLGARPSRQVAPREPALDQPFDAGGLAALRASVAAHGDDLGVPVAALDNLVIISSELATNAVRHGGGSGRLLLWRNGGEVVCQVIDGGTGLIAPAAGMRLPEPTAVGGRGLWLCRQLADTLVIESSPLGSTVTAAITLGGTHRRYDSTAAPQ